MKLFTCAFGLLIYIASTPQTLFGAGPGSKSSELSDTISSNCSCLWRTEGLLSARRIQYARNGRIIGIRLYAVESNGCMERVGFKNGDIIRQIDDTKIDFPDSGNFEEVSATLHPHEAALQTAKLVTIERFGTMMTVQCNKSK